MGYRCKEGEVLDKYGRGIGYIIYYLERGRGWLTEGAVDIDRQLRHFSTHRDKTVINWKFEGD